METVNFNVAPRPLISGQSITFVLPGGYAARYGPPMYAAKEVSPSGSTSLVSPSDSPAGSPRPLGSLVTQPS